MNESAINAWARAWLMALGAGKSIEQAYKEANAAREVAIILGYK